MHTANCSSLCFPRPISSLCSTTRKAGKNRLAGESAGGSACPTSAKPALRPIFLSFSPQIELLHLVAQRIAGDAQQARGLRLVAVGLLQSAGQQAPLVVLERKPVGGNVHARGHR